LSEAFPIDYPGEGPLSYFFGPRIDDQGTANASLFESLPGPAPGPYFDPACFSATNKPIFQDNLGLLDASLVMAKVYANDPAAQDDLKGFLRPGAQSVQRNNTASTTPGYALAWDSEQALIVIAGTTNFQQLASQIAYAGFGPVNVGTFSTNFQWYLSALDVGGRFSAELIDPLLPVTLVGHSYGGAIAAVLSAIFITAQPTRKVRLLTMGMPRPGDQRLALMLRNISPTFLANLGDPITSLPPVGSELIPLAPLVPSGLLDQWLGTAKPLGQVILGRDGSLTDDDQGVTLYSQLLEIVGVIVSDGVLPAFTQHTTDEYIRRLQLATNA